MAKIILNGNKEVKGLLTARRKLLDDGNILVSGELLTHRYIEDIYSIKTERYAFSDVTVHTEEFASNDFMIRYEFFAKSVEIMGGESNLPFAVINELESEFFKNESNELIHEEVYKKWN